MTITVDGTNGIVFPDNTAMITGNSLSSLRNRIINGDMRIDQRNSGFSQTITAGAALAYTVDRWYAYCTGANVSGSRTTGANAGLYRYQFIGAASVTGIGFGQRIESLNSADLANGYVTLSADLSNSYLTQVTWSIYYANSTDNFGTIASPSKTLIATGIFNVTSTVARYSVPIYIPSGTYTGLEVVFTVGTQTTGTWVIGNVQLEPGSLATPFARRPYGFELSNCQRYYYRMTPSVNSAFGSGYAKSTTVAAISGEYPVTMRVRPTALEQIGTAANYNVAYLATNGNCSSVPIFNTDTSEYIFVVDFTLGAVLTAGNAVLGRSVVAGTYLGWSAEL